MSKLIAVFITACLLVILLGGQVSGDSATDGSTQKDLMEEDDTEIEEELESEIQLKKMLSYVTPLMAIFKQQKKRWGKRSTNENESEVVQDTSEMVEEGRKRGRRPPSNKASQQQLDRMGNYYGEYASASGYGGGGGYYSCCDKKDELLPILALTALSLLLLYLIAIATTTTTVAGRRRRGLNDDDENDLIDENQKAEIDLMDAPTWLSMVDELWNADDENDEFSDACALKALCRMNHLALGAPGSAGLAISLSSVPLSYLLHHRHQSGFLTYLDASLMGRYGENCTTMFSGCPRLN